MRRKSVVGNREMLRERRIHGRALTGKFRNGWQGKLVWNVHVFVAHMGLSLRNTGLRVIKGFGDSLGQHPL